MDAAALVEPLEPPHIQVTLVGLAIDSSQPISCPAQCSASGNTISVTNISPPIQAQGEFPVTLTGQLDHGAFAGHATVVGIGDADWTGTRVK